MIEPALSAFFGVPAGSLAFRARIRNLQRLGLAPVAPGRGRRIRYTLLDVCDLALALSLSDVGADPREVVEIIESGTFKTIYQRYAVGDSRVFCTYSPEKLSENPTGILVVTEKQLLKTIRKEPRVSIINVSHILEYMKKALPTDEEDDF